MFRASREDGHHPQDYSDSLKLKESISWSSIATETPSFRYKKGDLSESAGMCIFPYRSDDCLMLLAYLNSSVALSFLAILAPTLNVKLTEVEELPVLFEPGQWDDAAKLALQSIAICRDDSCTLEASWRFQQCPLINATTTISTAFSNWNRDCRARFNELKSNEEELNRIFARIYHLEGEVPIEVPDDKVSVRRADLVCDVKSLISYGVGCIFGRYSLDKPGLVLADQDSTVADYLKKVPESKLVPNEDNILPITETAWFDDDIVDSFCRFLAAAYGAETLGQNVGFIENALGCDLRTYFAKGFYADHLKTYQKRPIYWLFQSPKKSFSCLVYMHRYSETTVGEILTKYLRPLQSKLRSRIDILSREKTAKSEKEINRLSGQMQELSDWERDVVYDLAQKHVRIDLDDGVKVNYNKFPHALAKVPGLSDWK